MNSIRWVQIGTLLALPVVGYNLYYTFTPTLLVLLSVLLGVQLGVLVTTWALPDPEHEWRQKFAESRDPLKVLQQEIWQQECINKLEMRAKDEALEATRKKVEDYARYRIAWVTIRDLPDANAREQAFWQFDATLEPPPSKSLIIKVK